MGGLELTPVHCACAGEGAAAERCTAVPRGPDG